MSIPKEPDGRNRPYGFVTYKHQVSVPYALSVFSGTKLFNRELRLNNRSGNKNNTNNNNGNNQIRGQGPMEPKPICQNVSTTHQFQLQNPFGNSALRAPYNNMAFGQAMNPMNNMMPTMLPQKMEFPQTPQLDYQQLLQLSAQMFSGVNDLNLNNLGNDNNESHKHQSKMMHRHENRSHTQNSNYSRDRDRRNDRRRDRSRSRDRDRNNTDWMRNSRGGRDNDRRDKNRGRNDNNRRR